MMMVNIWIMMMRMRMSIADRANPAMNVKMKVNVTRVILGKGSLMVSLQIVPVIALLMMCVRTNPVIYRDIREIHQSKSEVVDLVSHLMGVYLILKVAASL